MATCPYIVAVEEGDKKQIKYLYNMSGKKLSEQGFTKIEYIDGSFYVKVMKDGEEKAAWLSTRNFELEYVD